MTDDAIDGSGKPLEVGAGLWEFGDIGFDVTRKLWFVQLIDERNRVAGVYYGNSVTITKGCAIQYQWKDERKASWHVRERFFSENVERLSVDSSGTIIIDFKAVPPEDGPTIPSGFAYVCYAYHLSSNGDDLAPRGFLEFYDSGDALLKRLNNKWIVVEDVSRRTVGVFPAIRIRVEREELERVVATATTVLLLGSRHGSKPPR